MVIILVTEETIGVNYYQIKKDNLTRMILGFINFIQGCFLFYRKIARFLFIKSYHVIVILIECNV